MIKDNRVVAIAAIDLNGMMGSENALPWHVPVDLQKFRDLTINNTLIAGRRTIESLPRPLSNRYVIAVTRQQGYKHKAAQHVSKSIEAAFEHASRLGSNIIVIGGADIFRATMACWDELYLTIVESKFDGDTYFPIQEFDRLGRWYLHSAENVVARSCNNHGCTFLHLKREPSTSQSRPSASLSLQKLITSLYTAEFTDSHPFISGKFN